MIRRSAVQGVLPAQRASRSCTVSLALSRTPAQSSHHTTERHFWSTKSCWKTWSRTSSRSNKWLRSLTSISCAVVCLCLRDAWWYVIQSSEPQWQAQWFREQVMIMESRKRRVNVGVPKSEGNMSGDGDLGVALLKSCSATRFDPLADLLYRVRQRASSRA
jgi:hypothetical protein